MKTDYSISLISSIREKAYSFIIKELEEEGVYGIVPSHGNIIYCLLNNEKMTKSEIAEKIKRDKSTVTTLINKLIQHEYVVEEKDREDRRFSYISLTDKGREFEKKLNGISEKLFEKEYIGVSEEERKLFLSVLDKIYKNLSE